MEKKDNDRINIEEDEDGEISMPFEAEGENRFGRFKNADALYNSYLKLEAEFTRRSQQLKRLRNICAEHGLGEDGQPIPLHGAAKEEIADGATEEKAESDAEKAEALSADVKADKSAVESDVKERIIKEYLDGVAKGSVPLLKGGGGIVTAGKRKISSITQAGNLSLQYFREGKNK